MNLSKDFIRLLDIIIGKDSDFDKRVGPMNMGWDELNSIEEWLKIKNDFDKELLLNEIKQFLLLPDKYKYLRELGYVGDKIRDGYWVEDKLYCSLNKLYKPIDRGFILNYFMLMSMDVIPSLLKHVLHDIKSINNRDALDIIILKRNAYIKEHEMDRPLSGSTNYEILELFNDLISSIDK